MSALSSAMRFLQGYIHSASKVTVGNFHCPGHGNKIRITELIELETIRQLVDNSQIFAHQYSIEVRETRISLKV